MSWFLEYARVVVKVIVKQKTNGRSKVITFNFVNKITATDSWRDFTNAATVTLPKNLYVIDAQGNKTPLTNIGGYETADPLFMRGDEITIDYGYRYQKKGVEYFESTIDEKNDSHLFKGFITEVSSKKPIEIKCEDMFWKLKQFPCPNHTFTATDSLYTMLYFLVTKFNAANPNYPITIDPRMLNDGINTKIGAIKIGNETIAELLSRLRKQYHIESYFRGNVLYSGLIVYNEAIANKHTFEFQKNIISDDLQYRRKEDVVLSIVASNSIEKTTGELTKDGQPKTKKERLEILVTFRNGKDEPEVKVKEKGVEFPDNIGGERMSMQYPMAKSLEELKKMAIAEIKKYYYTGFKGKFTTFGLPFVKTGDNIVLIDNILTERNGTYKCKSVEYSAGVDGVRQIIQLDYKITTTK